MCGIVGAIGNLDASSLLTLLAKTEVRGKDATGFYCPASGVVKEEKKATDFLQKHQDLFLQTVGESKIFLGHTRYATHGSPKNNDNNHPIESENWIMVHNGVVAGMRDLNDYKYQSDTDTENLLAYIEHFGLEEGLSYCSSGAAILFINKGEENTIYFWKSAPQPLRIGYDVDNEVLYFFSEDNFFWPILETDMIEEEFFGGLFKRTYPKRKIRLTTPNTRELWKATINEGKIECEMIGKIESKTPSYSTTGSYHNNYYHNGWHNRGVYPESHLYYRSPQQKVQTEEEKIFVPNREGKHRPRVIKREEKKNQKVILVKDYSKTQVNAETVPTNTLEQTDAPKCFGINYEAGTNKCYHCATEDLCAEEFYISYTQSTRAPECIAEFDSGDDECCKCEWLVACVSERLVNISDEREYIEAEFKEVNKEIVKMEGGCA